MPTRRIGVSTHRIAEQLDELPDDANIVGVTATETYVGFMISADSSEDPETETVAVADADTDSSDEEDSAGTETEEDPE